MPQPYGQHFLRHVPHQLLQHITKIPPQTKFHVLEIGPGRGAVTKAILKLMPHTHPGSTLTLIEIDRKFIPHLQTIIAPYANSHLQVAIHLQDFLTFNLSTYWQNLPPQEPIIIIGSLPYESSKRIISKIVKTYSTSSNCIPLVKQLKPTKTNNPTPLNEITTPNTETKLPKKAHLTCSFIIQKEVAQTYTASAPRTTFLSSWLHTFTTNIKAHTTIKPKQFSPPPKVTSQILTFTTIASPKLFSHISTSNIYPTTIPHSPYFKEDPRLGEQVTNPIQAQKKFMIHIYTDFLHQMFRHPRKKIRTAWKKYHTNLQPISDFQTSSKDRNVLHIKDKSAIINQRPGELTPLQFQQLFWLTIQDQYLN